MKRSPVVKNTVARRTKPRWDSHTLKASASFESSRGNTRSGSFLLAPGK